MADFKIIDPKEISDNPFGLIGDDWMLVTAGNRESGFNTMTASWGGVGILWNKPVAFVFIRPGRYTDSFARAEDGLTLSFFGDGYRDALSFCGSHSGRDTDKIAATGLTPAFSDDGRQVWFEEARLVLRCRRMYCDVLKSNGFCDADALANYKNGDFHNVYVCEITEVLEKK